MTQDKMRTAQLSFLLSVTLAGMAHAQLISYDSFEPAKAGRLCATGLEPQTGNVWLYGCNATSIQQYSQSGDFLSQIPVPGEISDDVDLDFASNDMTFGSSTVPVGTLFYINGDGDTAQIHALDTDTGNIVETLSTDFGNQHVVGGAYHSERDSFFLVSHNFPLDETEDLVGEVDARTGEVLNTFDVYSSGFDVYHGDLDVDPATGNLLLVSSSESSIAEFTPTGTLVRERSLPADVKPLSGIGIDDLTGEIWVSELGRVLRSLTESAGDCNGDGLIDITDANCTSPDQLDGFLAANGFTVGDADGDGQVQFSDFVILANNFAGPGEYTDGDFDKDGTIQFGDFVILANKFGISSAATPVSPVPEPSTSSLLLAAALAFAHRLRRN